MKLGKGSQKRSKEPGLPPGTLVHIGKKRKGRPDVTIMEYGPDHITERKVKDVTSLSGISERDTVSWINVDGVHDEKLMENISDTFSIDPLIMEDIMNTSQRPKLDLYPKHLFMVLKMVKRSRDSGENIEQISLILGKGFVISFQEIKGDVFDPVRRRIRSDRGRIRRMGADYLAYALLDSVVDNYFPVMESIGDSIDRMERGLHEDPSDGDLNSIHSMKRNLIRLRRSIWPMREVINGLLRDGSTLMGEEVRPYLRDVYDHTIQVMDTLESLREMASSLTDLYMSMVSKRMNEVMKVLTIIATIFIPLTFISGVYGMNFDTDSSPFNMPELEWYWGYPAVMITMALIAIGMFIYFKKKKWL